MSSPLVGRATELAHLTEFLDSMVDGGGVILITGPSGIGKTSLWKAAVAEATQRGYNVATCRPVATERQLPFASLTDLLADVGEDGFESLPLPQRQALGRAVLRIPAKGPTQPLAVSLAALQVLRHAASIAPVLVAVDDVTWMDRPSERVLEFVVRRLGHERVGVILVERTPIAGDDSSTIVAAAGAERLIRLDVGPLSIDAIDRLLRDAFGIELVRPRLARVYQVSGGSPFYALEIGRALRDHVQGHGEVPLPALTDLVADRMATLSPSATRLALFVAAAAQPTTQILEVASGHSIRQALRAAVRAGVLEIDRHFVRFTHPLLAAHVYQQATDAQRATAHRRLAVVVTETVERARHLALSTSAPDNRFAGELDRAARVARARGAPDAAAELGMRAAELTSHAPGRRRRLVAAADYLVSSGDLPEAQAVLERVSREAKPGRERAEVLVHLGQVLMFTGERIEAARRFHEAAGEAGGDRRHQIRIETQLAGVAYLTWQEWENGPTHIQTAMRLAEELGDPVVLMETIGHFAMWEFAVGRGLRSDLIERAQLVGRSTNDVRLSEHPNLQFATILREIGDVSAARRRLEPMILEARNMGDWNSLPMLLIQLGKVEVGAGNWDRAESLYAEATSAASQVGQEPGNSHEWPAEIAALRGDVAKAYASASDDLRWSDDAAQPWIRRSVLTALALLELARNDAAAAEALLSPLVGARFPGWVEPAIGRVVIAPYAEALVSLGQLDRATSELTQFYHTARRHGRTIAVADALRSRSLVLSAQGDSVGALKAIDDAYRLHRALGLPFDTARTLLVAGEVRRRSRKKAAAREALDAALAIFDRLGAKLWAERARRDLARTGARHAPAAILTNSQRQVAELVAAGRTNREIAETLFISVRTVEAHLTRIFRILGLRSRTDLARHAIAGGVGSPSVSKEFANTNE